MTAGQSRRVLIYINATLLAAGGEPRQIFSQSISAKNITAVLSGLGTYITYAYPTDVTVGFG